MEAPATPKPDFESEPGPELSRPVVGVARSATFFAAIYLALVVGSPLIVRYGPSPDDHALTALAARMEAPKCIAAPASAVPCISTMLAAHATRPDPDL